ncbi:MAG TPA: glycosyltransferase [Gaiellaceae bacterium]|jgi:glycosyltransferase involved in cell wall biosynthesis
MKVLSVVHYANFGGPHNEALRLREPLRRRGWEIEVAIPDGPGSAAPRLEAGGVPLHALPLSRLRASPDPRLLLRFARDFGPSVSGLEQAIEASGADIVQIGGLVNPHAALAARRRGAAVVWQIVDSRAPAPLRLLAMPIVRRLADTVMFDGEALIELHGGRESLPAPVFVYFPPVDTTRFVPSADRRREIRAQLGIPEEAPVVGTVSSLNPMKGLEHFLDAAAQVAAQRPETWFVVVGGAPESHLAYRDQLHRRADELALLNPVVFAGERDDVERWYPAFDLHLITSLPRSEGTTTTAMEAQACGVSVVATRVAAVAEVVDDGVTGVLVPPERPDAIADAVLRLLGDGALRVRMGAAGREVALERFDVERAADVYVQAYEAALAHSATRR